jgi:hypothetical protein
MFVTQVFVTNMFVYVVYWDVCWLLRISVPKNALPRTLSDPLPLHLSIRQMAVQLLTLLYTALFENGYPQ